jgi:pimeloyl-ACP methyl ester carboxylesterase
VGNASIEKLSVDVDGLRLSGRIARPGSATRGVIVALHGGTYDSAYYDGGEDSLLHLGALLGYLVVALDRPGYGAVAHADPAHLTFEAQTRILSAAVNKINADLAGGAGVVLVGHSIGGMLAVCVAASLCADGAVIGLEVSGLGERWQPGVRELWASMIGDAPSAAVPAAPHAQLMLGLPGTYSARQQSRDAELLRPLPMPELIDVVDWADMQPSVAAKVTVPVSITLAGDDMIFAADPAALAEVARHFTASPSVRTAVFGGAGHSIELHHGARAYCLRQLAFAEELLSA